ncbi:MAG: ATPase domain-containing protein [Candidatus Micrarchaeota archaeon]
MERVTTGVDGLDELLEGGFPKGSVVLVSGSPGAGKTILGLQFLKKGVDMDERGLYITFEETRRFILDQAARFNWDLEGYEKEHKLKIVSLVVSHTSIEKVLMEIDELVKKFQPNRLVLDSLTMLQVYTNVLVDSKSIEMLGVSDKSYEAVTRKAVADIVERLRGFGATSIVTSELQEGSAWYSRDTVSEFICDGVIKLSKIETIGKRTLVIGKMRSTRHDVLPKPINIGEDGIILVKG